MRIGKVHIVGAGLIGGSMSLRLSELKIIHSITDSNPEPMTTLKEKGSAATSLSASEVDLVLIAVPPEQVLAEIVSALDKFPRAIVSDVASVKASFESEIVKGSQSHRYVGSHPMAGKEISGAGAADPSLFVDRIWIVCENSTNRESAKSLSDFINEFGSVPVSVPASEHDSIVAYISHLPQLVSSNLAEVCVDSGANLEVAGPAFRDMTRIAVSSPSLWAQILMANRHNVVKALDRYQENLSQMRDLLAHGTSAEVAERLVTSSQKASHLPGKHGGKLTKFAAIKILVPDKPGALAAAFALAGEIDLNIEDVSIDHVLNKPVAILSILVAENEHQRARAAFKDAGWEIRE
ncbi:MAG: prephenate dehydrogenase/arogenate dehydrogenase family protein [Candidatus Nanopelagicales bacterium]